MASNNNEVRVTFKAFNQEFNKAIGEIRNESSRLRQEFKLQQEQLKENGTESEKLSAKMDYLRRAQQLSAQEVAEAQSAYERAKALFGENSVEADRMSSRLLEAQIAAQRLANQITQTEREQQSLAEGTRRLNTIFEATGTSLEEYENALGVRLTNAIRNGTATSRDLEAAFQRIGRQAIGTQGDIAELRRVLASVDSGNSIENIRRDLQQLETQTEETQGSVKELGGELAGLAAGAIAGGGIAGVIEKSLDISSLNTKINISMDVPEESKAAVKEAIKAVEAYGIDAETALSSVQKQWKLTASLTDEENTKLIKQAGTIVAAYSNIDLTELIQEENEMALGMEMTHDEALGMTKALLDMGFPPEQLDIITEYGQQLTRAGYDASEIQNIFAAGIQTGTWNIDNLMDGLKEGRIVLAEFGAEVPKAIQDSLEGTAISARQVQAWGQAMAAGGDQGKQAMMDVALALSQVEDETKRNELGVAFFGTLWEEQGSKITETILGAKDGTADLSAQQQQLNEDVAALDADPAVQMKQALSDMMTVLTPLLLKIADFVGKVAAWISENPKLVATITAVVTAVGILLGILMALAPIFTALQAAAATFSIGLLPLIGIVAGIVAGIALLIAAGVAIYQNWDTIKAKAIEIWNAITEWLTTAWESIKTTASATWTSIKETVSATWTSIKEFFFTLWEGIKSVFSTVMTAITGVLSQYWDSMKVGIETVWNGIKLYFQGLWEVLKNVFLGALLVVIDLLTGNWDAAKSHTEQIWNNIKEGLSTMWEGVKSIFSGALAAVMGFITTHWNNIKTVTSTVFEAMKTFLSNTWNTIKSTVSSLVEGIKNTVRDKFNDLKSAVNDKMTEAKNKITEIWNQAKSFLTGIDLKQIGKDIIQGLINGIQSKLQAIKNAMKDAADAVTGKVKSLLGIKSPSRVLMEIGEWTGEGLAIGIENMKNSVAKAAEVLAQQSIPDLQSTSNATRQNSQSFSERLPLSVIANTQPLNITVVSELDGYEVARNQYEYIEGMLNADVSTKMFIGGVKQNG